MSGAQARARHCQRQSRLTPTHRRTVRGFTIVSMLVAIILLAVGMMSLATASASTMTLQTQAQNRTNAIAIARGYLELVRTRDPWTLVSEGTVKLNADGQVASTGAFTRSMQVTVTRQNLLRVELAVSYPRSTQPVTLTTSFFRGNGLTAVQ